MNSEPNTARAWWMLSLLAMLYASSYVDRFILALLIEPITKDLGVTDGQMGLLVGGAFSLLYAVLAFPAAAWLDRHTRKWAVVAGVFLWSTLTILSGFANDFLTLQLCRAGVALGEAVLTPAALSLIADCFPPQKRAFPTAVYVSVASVMGTGTYILGSAALGFATDWSSQFGLEPWRLTLMLVGVPGLAIGMIFAFTTTEPSRKTVISDVKVKGSGLTLLLTRHGSFILVYFVSVGFVVSGGLAAIIWTPTILIREHGFDVAKAGYLYGLCALPASAIGVYLWAGLSQTMERKGVSDAAILLVVIGSLFSLPFATVGPLSSDSLRFLIAASIAPLGVAAIPPMAALVVQTIGTSGTRAMLAAIYLLSTSVIGLGGGAIAVPLVADWLTSSGRPLGTALAIISSITYLLPALVLLCLRNRYRKIRREIDQLVVPLDSYPPDSKRLDGVVKRVAADP